MSRSHDQDTEEERNSRGVKRQKYPLDDYLINNTNTQTSLLSPVSPVSSPETVDVLQNAERLVRSAQKQMMEVSFNSALNTFHENLSNYIGEQPLDENLLYIRELVDSKFQESNDPNKNWAPKTSPNNLTSWNRKSQDDLDPVKESIGMLNKPLEISHQNSEFSAGRTARRIFVENEKPFFEKAPDWFNMKPPEHIKAFPISTNGKYKAKTKSTCTVPCCMVTNTGVIEINGRDNLNGSIQVQTGPTVDIRRELKIQTIENVHISPDPSSVPIYNNVATYYFEHEPSKCTSFVDSTKTYVDKNNITSSSERNSFNAGKERHIQSTNYNETHSSARIENIHNADTTLIKNLSNFSRDMNQDTIGTQTMLNDDSINHTNSNDDITDGREVDLNGVRNKGSSDNNVIGSSKLYKSSIVNENVQSDKQYAQHMHVCGNECETASCTRKCESNVEHREKQELKEASETIANIEKLRFDIRDTGIISAECTQICEDENRCDADMVVFDLEPFSEPERFKTALNNLCKLSQNNRVSIADSDSKAYRAGIDAFVKMFFDSNSRSDYIVKAETADQYLKNEGNITNEGKNNQSTEGHSVVEKMAIQTQKEEIPKPLTQVKLIPETKKTKYQLSSKTINPKNKNVVVKNVSPIKNNTLNPPTRQLHTGQLKAPNKYSKPVALQNSNLKDDRMAWQDKASLGITSEGRKNNLENLDLTQPCISEVDAVLKTYRESMAAIRQGTKQLSQLISHHVRKNALSSPDQISSSPVPNYSIDFDKMNVEPHNISDVKISGKSIANLVSHGSSEVRREFVSMCLKNSVDQSLVEKTLPNRIHSVENVQQKLVHGRIPRHDVDALRGGSDSSHENNSVPTNDTRVSTINESPSICSSDPSEQAKSLSSTNRKCISAKFDGASDNTSHFQSTSKISQQAPVNIRTQSASKQNKDLRGLRKPGGNQLMNVRCCITEPVEALLPNAVTSAKKNCPSQSDLRTPLSTYVNLENACGKDIGLRRHSNYDIRNDQAGDFSLYKCPVLIPKENFGASYNDANDKLTAAERVVQTKEIELQVFGQVLDAVQNSAQFMEGIIISLLNGIEVESIINDIIRNLEDAAVHPIVIKQFLVILRERNKDKSLFGGNLVLRNPEPVSNDLQKNYNEPRDLPETRDNLNSFEHSTGFNGTMETTNIHINAADKDSSPSHPGGDAMTKSTDPVQNEINISLEMIKDCSQLVHNRNNPSNCKVECKMIHEKHAMEEVLKKSQEDLVSVKTTFENKSRLSEPALTLPCKILLAPVSENVVEKKPQQDCQEVEEKSVEVKHYQHNIAISEGKSNMTECSSNSISSNAISKKNDSGSNTDKDISFLLPHDADEHNEVVDLSSVQKLTSVTLKHETTGEIIEIQIESNCQNCSRLNSHTQERSAKIKSNSDSTKSSSTTNRSSGKLQNSDDPTAKKTNLIQKFQADDRSIICHCQRPQSQNAPDIKARYIPFGSTRGPIDVLNDSQIQSNYKQLGLINCEEKPFCGILNKTTTLHEKTSNKRPNPSKLSATSKGSTRKTNNSGQPGGKKKRSVDKKVIGSAKVSRDNKQGSMKTTKNTDITDSVKSDVKTSCLLCIQLQGDCSCGVGTTSITNLKKTKQVSPKSKKEKVKPVKNETSPRQIGSPKHSGKSADKYSSRKELSFSSTPVLLEYGKNVNNKNIDYSPDRVKNNDKSIGARTAKEADYKAPKLKVKLSSRRLNSNSSSNDGSVHRKAKPIKDKKSFQDAASDSDNLKVEDKSQCTAKNEAFTVCESIETQNTVILGESTVCRSTETSCKKLSIVEQISRLLPIKPNYFANSHRIDKPMVKGAVVAKCFENCSLMQSSFADYRNTHLDRTDVTTETITECTEEMKDVSTMGCQTSEICSTAQQHQPNPLKTVAEAGTASVFKTNSPNIFDEESIIVLQPLNGLDHTFFISKPNCVEKKKIQEKFKKRFNELNQHDEVIDKELTYPHGETIEQVNSADKGTSKDSIKLHSTISPMSCLKNEECQAGCSDVIEMEDPINNKQSVVSFAPMHVTDSNDSISKHKEECEAALCTNDEECLRICSQPPAGLDNLNFHCKNDCPHEEICLRLCPSVSKIEPLQTTSININGILKKFIAENKVVDVKLPIAKGLLKELKKVEDSLRGENEKLGTIVEKSEPQCDRNEAGCLIPRCSVEESSHKSIKYEEPHEKLKGIMSNRKSLILPNVVREIADMHPSTRLEHLKLRSADPLVSGSFNKSESDRRYSVFNQTDPENSTINLNDPKTQAHLAAIAQRTRVQSEKESSSDSSLDISPSILMEVIKNTPTVGKSNSKTASKLNKSRRGMDADSNPSIGLNKISAERDNNSMKSFESYDLEPGEFLQVRTPFDNPTSCQFSEKPNFEVEEVLRDRALTTRLSIGLRNNNKNHSRSVINADSTDNQGTTTNQCQTPKNKYELCLDFSEAVDTSKKHEGHSDKFISQSHSVSPKTVKSVVNRSPEIFARSDLEFGVSNHDSIDDEIERFEYITTDDSQSDNQSTGKLEIDKNSSAKNVIIIQGAGFANVNSNTLKVIKRLTRTKGPQYSERNSSPKMNKDAHGFIDENRSIDYFQQYFDHIFNGTERSSRPQIIDHFLGKRRLEDWKIDYTNNKTDTVSGECQSLRGNCQRLSLKSDFTLKTTPDSASDNIMDSPDLFTTRNDAANFNFSSRTRNKIDLKNSDQTIRKHWDQTSSDMYSEGEINLPSSCSYSLGEVKISTPNGTTAGKSFKDPDGLTIFVTKSILDSTLATCTSPGEILADIQKTETDFSSSIS